MNAYINIWGNVYYVETISWFKGKGIHYVSFSDENKAYHTVFNSNYDGKPIAREELGPNDVLTADLDKRVTFEHEKATAATVTKEK